MRKFFLTGAVWCYEHVLTKVLFLFDSETIHVVALRFGRFLGKVRPFAELLARIVRTESPVLKTTVGGITFENPVGLAAGFDYEADLPHLYHALGFGFGTVGTLTHMPYEGNPKPRLGRLVRSRALLVNKGFKNRGIKETLAELGTEDFVASVGVSVGRTNTTAHTTQREAVDDIVLGFGEAEASNVPFHYYELNISCPNLLSPIEFYEPEHLRKLLDAVAVLGLTRPIFVKMPTTLKDEETVALVRVVREYPIAGIIIGNLSKNREHSTLDKEEVKNLGKGNLSGMPCRDRSDELIALLYKETEGKLPIIGCGGVFSGEDAYRKIRLGASLIELVTGLVFRGPFLPALINAELRELLTRDGFKNVADAVGVDARNV